jgi:AraC family ethanolamine operon transcriptional activator
MDNPQPLPSRSSAREAGSVEEFSALQPERGRLAVQIHPGRFRSRLREISWGTGAIQEERWESGVRVRCDRSADFIAFGLIAKVGDGVRWNGASVETGTLVRVTEPWEAVSSSLIELVGFGLGRKAFDAAKSATRGPDRVPTRVQDRLVRVHRPESIAYFLRRSLGILDQSSLEPAALTAMEDDLTRLALRIDGEDDETPVQRRSSPSRRRAVVRRIEEYLDANGDVVVSVPTLCGIAGASERTLEYAFREQIGITPARYLKLRRMSLVRRRLGDPERSDGGVTRIALDCGFYDLGRFAGEYGVLFGEAPSETLARARAKRRSAPCHRPPAADGRDARLLKQALKQADPRRAAAISASPAP